MQCVASHCSGFCCRTWAPGHRPNSCGACGPGVEPMSPATLNHRYNLFLKISMLNSLILLSVIFKIPLD